MRPSFIALALFAPCLAVGNPLFEQVALKGDGAVHTTEGWQYQDCGWCDDLISRGS